MNTDLVQKWFKGTAEHVGRDHLGPLNPTLSEPETFARSKMFQKVKS